eukprot:2103874-Pyramimonas_sp.AAC.1
MQGGWPRGATTRQLLGLKRERNGRQLETKLSGEGPLGYAPARPCCGPCPGYRHEKPLPLKRGDMMK